MCKRHYFDGEIILERDGQQLRRPNMIAVAGDRCAHFKKEREYLLKMTFKGYKITTKKEGLPPPPKLF